MSITGFDQLAPDAWDAFNGFPFNRSLLSILDPCSGFADMAGFAMASVDWKETPEAHVLKVDLPGMKKEEVKVEVEGNLIRISGERAGEQVDEKDGTSWHLVERSSGKFMRSLRLPENARMDDVKAAMENGVLTVTVPKAAEDDVKMPKVKPVEIECVKKEHPSCLKLPRLFRSKKPDQADQKTSH